VAQADPKDFRAAEGVASCTRRIGALLAKMGEWKESAERLRQAISRYEDLTRRAPADWATARNLAEAHVDLAETLAAPRHRLGDGTQPVAEYQKALAIYVRLRDQGVLPAPDVRRIDELRADEAKEKEKGTTVKPGAQ
jgi:hypothetical protein